MKKRQPPKLSDRARELQSVNALRMRALQVKHSFLERGITNYMGFFEAQAAKEGTPLDADGREKLRQVINAKLSLSDKLLVEMIERALEQAA